MSPSSLKSFARDIWIADGPSAVVAGFRYPTRMAAIRLSNGDLFIWSPIDPAEDLLADVDRLGRVRHIAAPNSLHHLFLPAWRRAYPDAVFYAPPGLRKKRPDIAFDADLADVAPAAWAKEIDQVVMRGNLITSEIVFFHVVSGTVLFADLLQQLPGSMLSGWRAIVAKLDLMTGSVPSVPRKFRLAFVNRQPARLSLRRIQSWPVEKVLMAHGAPVEEDARTFLRTAFAWLGT